MRSKLNRFSLPKPLSFYALLRIFLSFFISFYLYFCQSFTCFYFIICLFFLLIFLHTIVLFFQILFSSYIYVCGEGALDLWESSGRKICLLLLCTIEMWKHRDANSAGYIILWFDIVNISDKFNLLDNRNQGCQMVFNFVIELYVFISLYNPGSSYV